MRNSNGRAIIGLLFVVFGILLIIDNFSNINVHFFSWPIIFIIIGAIILSGSHRSPSGLFLFIFGILGLFSKLLGFSLGQLFSDFWPAALVVLGLYLIIKPRKVNNYYGQRREEFGNDFLDETAIFTDNQKKMTSQNFSGGKITTLFGSTTLDLREVNFAKNNNILDVFTIFGGIIIKSRNDSNILINTTSIFGGFQDKRIKNIDEIPQSDRSLKITGLIIFGGGEIKN